jgi:RHS repeat-associated protein
LRASGKTRAEVQRLTYQPFGETHSNTGTVDFLQRRFTGQEQDPETGLYFYNARYYNPILGRFLSPDSIVPEPGNPQSLNRYSYVENNPVNRIDPSGHFSFGRFFRSLVRAIPAIVVGMVVGAVGTYYLGPVLGGMLGGAAAGDVNTAVNGGNLGRNILLGAALGGIAGAVAGPLFGALGGNAAAGFTAGNFAAAVGTGAILGGALGGLAAAIGGGNVLDGMLGGTLGGALVAAAAYAGAYAWNKIVTSPALAEANPRQTYAQASASDAVDAASADIQRLARLGFTEAAEAFEVPGAMEGVMSVARNRVESGIFPGSYEGVIHQPGQFQSVGGSLWQQAGNPAALTGRNAAAYATALTVAEGIYYGTIPDPTGGALCFHSGPRIGWFERAFTAGRIRLSIPDSIGPFTFYK